MHNALETSSGPKVAHISFGHPVTTDAWEHWLSTSRSLVTRIEWEKHAALNNWTSTTRFLQSVMRYDDGGIEVAK